MMDILYIVSGLVFLFLGGECLLNGSISLARSFRISKFLIGAVIIGFGTSMPELMVSAGAALKGAPDIALGNVIGSNITNVLLIVGTAALISPLFVADKSIKRDIFVMLFSGIMLAVMMWLNRLDVVSGVIFLMVLTAYIVWSFIDDIRHKPPIEESEAENPDLGKLYKPVIALLMAIIGLVGLIGGANLLVDGAVLIARSYGIPEAIIGLTMVAVGTSLPELATAVMASMKKQGDIILGNILGSSIFNILAILGITSLVKPIPVSPHLMTIDIWVMLLIFVCFAFLLLNKIKMGKQIAAVMLLSYVSYYVWLYVSY